MNKTVIWQKFERLLEKTEKSDLVLMDRANFEQVLKDASDYVCIEIENAPVPDLLEKLRKELSTLPMKSVQGTVLRIGIPPASQGRGVINLLKMIQELISCATFIWGCGEDPAIHSGCYSVTVIFAMSGQ